MFQARCLLLDWDAEVWKGCKGLRCLGLCALVVVEGVGQPARCPGSLSTGLDACLGADEV
jgi:hypothetical protein